MINSFFTMALQEMEAPQFFPFPFSLHIGFCVVALIFFLLRFLTDKKPYQMIMGIAIPLSLLLWTSDSRFVYYAIGTLELILILSAFLSTFFYKDTEQPVEVNAEQTDDSEEQE